ADCEFFGKADAPIRINGDARGGSTKINQHAAQILFFLRDNGIPDSEKTVHGFSNPKARVVDRSPNIIEVTGPGRDDVNLDFEEGAFHPDGIGNALLTVQDKILWN